MHTPVLSLFTWVLSNSVLFLIFSRYDSISSKLEILSLFLSIIGCSGATTMKVTPYRVSGLVVNITNSSSVSFTLKLTSAPVDLPIQLIWAVFILSWNLVSSSPVIKSSA